MNATCGSPLYWRNCYSGTYDLIAPDSYAHPAKMSTALCFRIMEHLEELGLLKQGDTILDCMAGTGLSAICAGAKDYKAITVELEEKFIGFQKQNLEYAERKLYKKLDWQMIQGDSRNLSNLLAERGVVTVTSPPYAEAQSGGGIAVNGYQGNKHSPTDLVGKRSYMPDTAGQTMGQISNLKDVPLVTLTSPPYANRVDDHGVDQQGYEGFCDKLGKYGSATGQIGSLPDKPLVSVMSPPYEGGTGHGGNPTEVDAKKHITAWVKEQYGNTSGQIENEASESYLSAMSKVYSEIAKVSNVLAIVLKNPTRGGKLRRLDLDTISLLEKSGWKIHCLHRALLFEELETPTMFDGNKKRVKGRLSFFKRLSYQKGQPVASWEDIIIAVRI